MLQGNYGYGWDDLCYYNDDPQGWKEQKDDLKAHRENERGVGFRIITRKEPNPDYKAPDDRYRVYPFKYGYNGVQKDGETKKFTDIEDAISYATSLDQDCVLKDVVSGYNTQIYNKSEFNGFYSREDTNKDHIDNFRKRVSSDTN